MAQELPVEWSSKAKSDLRKIVERIWQDSPSAGQAMMDKLLSSSEILGICPFFGEEPDGQQELGNLS